jgi:Xaa-Pro aminopeptidase
MPTETPVIQWKIGQPEYAQRVERVRAVLAERKLDALVLFHPLRMAYVSGFFHVTTERPMAIVIPASGDGLGALIPLLEQEHIAKAPSVTAVKVYSEYPTGGTKHPMHHLIDLLKQMKLTGKGARIGYDGDGYLDANGYDGPTLTETLPEGIAAERARDIIDVLRAVKSEAELAFIKESCVWGNLAHRLMQQRLELGRSEIEISLEASVEASKAMVAALGRATSSSPTSSVPRPSRCSTLAPTPPCPTASPAPPVSAAATSSSPAPGPTSAATTPSSSGP